jgi:hypothetical protein
VNKDTVQDFWDVSNLLKGHEFEKKALVQKNFGKQVFFSFARFRRTPFCTKQFPNKHIMGATNILPITAISARYDLSTNDWIELNRYKKGDSSDWFSLGVFSYESDEPE